MASNFELLRTVLESIIDDNFDDKYGDSILFLDNYKLRINKTCGLSESFNMSRSVEVFQTHDKDHRVYLIFDVSYTNLDDPPKFYFDVYTKEGFSKTTDAFDVKDYDDTELLLLLGKNFTDENIAGE